MKPFRIYEVNAGMVSKVITFKHDYHTLEEAEEAVKKESKSKWTKGRQFAIFEYTDAYEAKIVKLIDT